MLRVGFNRPLQSVCVWSHCSRLAFKLRRHVQGDRYKALAAQLSQVTNRARPQHYCPSCVACDSQVSHFSSYAMAVICTRCGYGPFRRAKRPTRLMKTFSKWGVPRSMLRRCFNNPSQQLIDVSFSSHSSMLQAGAFTCGLDGDAKAVIQTVSPAAFNSKCVAKFSYWCSCNRAQWS